VCNVVCNHNRQSGCAAVSEWNAVDIYLAIFHKNKDNLWFNISYSFISIVFCCEILACLQICLYFSGLVNREFLCLYLFLLPRYLFLLGLILPGELRWWCFGIEDGYHSWVNMSLYNQKIYERSEL
jgi:hypothetical protein